MISKNLQSETRDFLRLQAAQLSPLSLPLANNLITGVPYVVLLSGTFSDHSTTADRCCQVQASHMGRGTRVRHSRITSIFIWC